MTPSCASVSPAAQKSEFPAFRFWVTALNPSNRALGGCNPRLPQVKPPGAAGRALHPVPSGTPETCPSQKCSSRSIPLGMCCKTKAVAEFCSSAGREERNLLGNKISSLPWSLRVLAGSGAVVTSLTAPFVVFQPLEFVFLQTRLCPILFYSKLFRPVLGSLSLRAHQPKNPDLSGVVTSPT